MDLKAYRIQQAEAAHQRGWALMPLRGKVPTQDAWQKQPRPTLEQVHAWAADGNLGLRTGPISRVLVVDEDTTKGGNLEAVLGSLPITPTVITGGGGRHLYFRAPAQCPGNSASRIGPHIDTRGEGGQVVFVGSVHPVTSKTYEWEPGLGADEVELAELAPELLALLVPPPDPPRDNLSPAREKPSDKYGAAALENESRRVATAGAGTRNEYLNEAAFSLGQLVEGGVLPEHLVVERLEAAAIAAGLDQDREGGGLRGIRATIASGLTAGKQHPRTIPEPATRRRRMRVVRPDEAPPPEQAEALPDVLIPGSHVTQAGEYLEIGNDDFAGAVLEALPEGVLYRMAEEPGEITGDAGAQAFRRLTNERARLLIDQQVRLGRWAKKKSDEVAVCYYQNANRDLAALVLAAAQRHPRVRDLRHLTAYPVFMGPELELARAGWNEAHGVYYDEPPALAGLHVEHSEWPESRVQALLEDLVADFPFKADCPRPSGGSASFENFMGLLLTPMLRPALDGNVPLHLLLSPIPRTGKSKLAEDVLGGLILGRPTPARSFGDREEEREKRIVGVLRDGLTVVHLDNLREFLDSAHLSSLLTAREFSARQLGTNDVPPLPNNLTLVASGNNVRATDEIAKRTVPIVLAPTTDHPEDRTDFRHPDLRGFVTSSRRDVLSALLAMVLRWRDGERTLGCVPKGGFERWAEVVGGILLTQGMGKWRSNERAWIRAADTDGEDLRAFVEAWAERPLLHHASAQNLFEMAENLGLFTSLKGETARARQTSFGMRILRKNIDAPVGNWIIRRQGSGNVSQYFLESAP